MNRRWLLLVLIWAPFASLFIFAAPFWGGDTYSHVLFHALALALLVWAFAHVRAARSAAVGRSQRLLVLVLPFSLPLAILGHFVEFITAVVRLVDEGGANVATDDIFEDGLHALAANITVPAMLLSMITALVLVIVTVVHGRASREALDAEDRLVQRP